MSLNMLLEQVKEAVLKHADQQNGQSGKCDPAALIAQVEALFQQHQKQHHPQYSDQPQGMDPYGGLPDETGKFQQDEAVR